MSNESQRKKLNKMNEPGYGSYEKLVKITWDGKQFLARFPSEVSEILSIKKGDKLEFKLELAAESIPLKESKLSIKLVRG